MVRPLKMAVLLLSVHPLLDQRLLHLHPTHMTDLPTYVPPEPARDCPNPRSEHFHLVSQQPLPQE